MNTFISVRRRIASTILLIVLIASWGAAAKTVLTMWTMGHVVPTFNGPYGEGGMRAAKERFEELNPDIELEIHEGLALDKVKLAIAAGSSPDVATVDGFIVKEMALNGWLMSIDNLVAGRQAIAAENMAPGHWDMVHGFDGRLYGIGALVDNVGFWSLYYNNHILAQAGFAELES